MVMINKGLR